MGAASDDDHTLDLPEGEVPAAPPRAPRYSVEGELARGGLGRVLLAHDEALDRPVALKTLLQDSAHARLRFEREARFIARLQHPAIIPIYEMGADAEGVPFYAMRLVSGRTLADAIQAAPDVAARLALLPHVLTVANALAYAHERGVVHRDVKPHNVLLGPFGETLLIDWGVAKAVGDDDRLADADALPLAEGLTVAGAVVGTPAYMAPEQARGDAVDRRADVYSLGATLYHVLAGGTPFPGDTATTLDALRRGATPEPLARRAPGAPLDLQRIVEKAMAPRAEARYASAVALAEDLRRFQTGQLVSAREYRPAELLARWLRQHRRGVGVTLAALLAVAVVAAVGVARVVAERDRTAEALEVAQARAEAMLLTQAESASWRDPTVALAWLAAYPPAGAEPQRWFELTLRAEGEGVARAVLLTPRADPPEGLHPLPSGRMMTVGLLHVALWDAAAGRQLDSVQTRSWTTSALGAEGDVLVGQREGGVLRVRGDDPVAAQHLVAREHPGLPAGPDALAAGPGGRAAAAVRGDLYELDGERWVRRDRPATLLAYAGDGLVVAAGPEVSGPSGAYTLPGPVAVLAASGAQVASASGADVGWHEGSGALQRARLPAEVLALALAGGAVFAADVEGSVWRVDGEVQLLHRHAGAERITGLAARLNTLPEAAGALPAASSSAFEVLSASGAGDLRFTRLVPAGAGRRPSQRTTALRGHHMLHLPPVLLPGTALAVTGSMNATLRVWDLPDPGVTYVHDDPAAHAVFSPDGRALLVDGIASGVLLQADPVAGGATVVKAHTDNAYGLDAAAVGHRFLSVSSDGTARVWDADSGAVTLLRGHDGRVRAGHFTPDGARVYTVGNDGTLRRFEVRTGEGQVLVRGAPLWDVELMLGGDVPAVVGQDGVLRTVTGGAVREVARELGGAEPYPFQLTRVDDRRVVVCRPSMALAVIDVVSGVEERFVAPQNATGDVRRQVDCNRVVPHLRPDDGRVQLVYMSYDELWVMDGTGARRIGAAPQPIHDVVASGDHRRVMTLSLDGTAIVWELSFDAGGGIADPPLARARVLPPHDGAAFGGAFTPDGGSVVTVGADRRVRLTHLDEGRWVPRDPQALAARLRRSALVVNAGVVAPRLASDAR